MTTRSLFGPWLLGKAGDRIITAYDNLYYDAASPKSVLFPSSGCPEKIEELTAYFNNRFNQAFRSNFQGEKGIHEMEADIVRGFENLVRDYETVQFMDGLKKEFDCSIDDAR
ncbi:hypothetical protein SAMN05446935_8412 [Burkholderia sp. YR290]|nr:hypothetical protein SAMN05446935_8412 [Burkholderia sp. YR290]